MSTSSRHPRTHLSFVRLALLFTVLVPTLLTAMPAPADEAADSVSKPKFFKRVARYFARPDTSATKRFDFGVLPGPHYSSTAGLGLGIVATGLYSMAPSDSTLPRSNVAIFSDVTTKGFLMVGIRGNNIFPHERYRLDYRLYVYTFPTKFWGIGYTNALNAANETDYRRDRFDAMGRFMIRIGRGLYLGPVACFQYFNGSEVDEAGRALFAGQDLRVRALSAGLSLTYDTRDFILNATRGWFVQLDQTFTPRFLGNDYCFSATELTASTYRRVWSGGVLAGEWHSRFTYGNPAWCLLSEVGSNTRMRGYYEGRYRDKNIMEMQVELRQHIAGRSGIAVWAGAAQVFPEAKALRWRHTLPNFGLGYRWEFRRGVNVRIDYGLTRHGGGLVFSINEAF